MSEEQKSPDKAPETKPAPETAKAESAGAAKPATPPAEKPAAPAAKAPVEPPQPPPPGEFGKLLAAEKLAVEHLGPDAQGQEMVRLTPGDLLTAARFLRDDSRCRMDLLVSVTGVDWKDRLEAVYHVYSTENHKKVAIKVTAENEHIPSVTPVWPAADWHEREAYDLFGIIFDGHPNLTRILMPSDWVGHPMRKDYKVEDPRLVWNQR